MFDRAVGWIAVHGGQLTLYTAVGAALACMLWESLRPLRPWSTPGFHRVAANIGLRAINWLVARAALVSVAGGVVALCGTERMCPVGVFRWPIGISITLSILVPSLVQYVLHRAFHAVPWLWRIHRVHHSDLDLDFSTGIRHHPLEALISASAHAVAVVGLGLHPLGVLIWGLLEGMAAFFTHVNARLAPTLDRALAWVLVTPGMHRIHHLRDMTRCNANYGTLLPWWDRMFGTFHAPRAGDDESPLGVSGWERPADLGFARLLWMPFRSQR